MTNGIGKQAVTGGKRAVKQGKCRVETEPGVRIGYIWIRKIGQKRRLEMKWGTL